MVVTLIGFLVSPKTKLFREHNRKMAILEGYERVCFTKECFSYLAKNKSRNFPLAWLTSPIFKRICFSPLLEQKWAHQKFPMLIQQIRNSFWLYACALDEQVQWFQDKNNHEYAVPRLHLWLYWSRKWENPKVNGLYALDHTHQFKKNRRNQNLSKPI